METSSSNGILSTAASVKERGSPSDPVPLQLSPRDAALLQHCASEKDPMGRLPPLAIAEAALEANTSAADEEVVAASSHAAASPSHPQEGEAGEDRGSAGSAAASDTHPGLSIPLNLKLLLVMLALSTSFSTSILGIFMNQELKYGPVEITQYWMYVGFIWWTEPLVGVFSESIAVCGERRRPLFLFACFGSICIYLFFCFFPTATSNFRDFMLVAVTSHIFTVAEVVAVNSVLVDLGRWDGETTQQSTARISALVSTALAWRCFGTLLGAVLQTTILVELSVYRTLGLTGGLYAVLMVLMASLPKHHFEQVASRENVGRQIFNAIKSVRSIDPCDPRSDGRRFLMVLVFVFLYTMMPDSSNVYYNYLYSFRFPTWFYSLHVCFGYCGNTAGSLLFSFWMKRRASNESPRCSTFFLFLVGSLAWVLGYATNLMLCTGFAEHTLHIRPMLFVPFDNFWSSMCAVLASVPIILSSTEHAPQGLELSCMQFFSVAAMAGNTVSSALTLALLHAELHNSLWQLIVISIFSRLFIVPLAVLLPDREHDAPERVSLLAAVDVSDEEGWERQEEVVESSVG